MKAWRIFHGGIVSMVVGGLCFLLYFFKPASLLNENKIGGDFSLLDQNGSHISTTDWRGKIVLLFFGYISCNHMCHKILSNISEALQILNDNLYKVIPVFITINPERDTSDNLKVFSEKFSDRFVMMTGNTDQINAVLKKYKVYRKRIDSDKMVEFSMEHSNLIYVLDKNGILIHLFDQNTSSQDLAVQIKKLLEF